MTDAEIAKAKAHYEYGITHDIFQEPVTSYAKTVLWAFEEINRLKSEVERFKGRQKPTWASGYKIENGKVVFFTNMLGGYRHEYKDLEEVVKSLNELLQEAYSKDEILFHYRCAREDLKTAKSEVIKEFAERLKKTMIATHKTVDGYCRYETEDYYIDNLVKEMTE